jgi:hypothetical protein
MRSFIGSTLRVTGGGVTALAGGMLTRPCCLAPALLSLTGGSAAGLGRLFAGHHVAFAVMSLVLLSLSVWINVTLHAQPWNKWLAAVSSVTAFVLVARGVWF